MKILWLTNITLPIISKALNETVIVKGGWLDVLSKRIANSNGQLAVSFPKSNVKDMISGKVNGVNYYAIPSNKKGLIKYEKQTELYYEKILVEFQPDIIHIWGTEFPRTLAMVNVCQRKKMIDKVIVDIQGLCSVIAKSATASLPQSVVNKKTLYDLLFGTSIAKQQKNIYKRGVFEIEALEKIKRVMGRTDWDHACIQKINPNAEYYHCNRILRNSFYNDNKWKLNTCQRYALFTSQSFKPLKGLHYILEAMPIILKSYPDTHLYIAGGGSIRKNKSIKEKLKLTSYGKYLSDIIDKYNLKKHITILGPLHEQEMHKQFLKSQVFISASSMENSPNTVAEAMMLGVPTVASDVGGVSSMLTHNKEGFLYQHDAPYMMAYFIKRIFEDDDIALELSKNAIRKAEETYNKEKNYNMIMEVYSSIIGGAVQE